MILLKLLRLLILATLIAGLGYYLRPQVNASGERTLLRGVITQAADGCRTPLLTLEADGSVSSEDGICDGISVVVIDNKHIVNTTSIGDYISKSRYDKHNSNWKPGQIARVVAVKDKAAYPDGRTRYSLGCDLCRIWVIE